MWRLVEGLLELLGRINLCLTCLNEMHFRYFELWSMSILTRLSSRLQMIDSLLRILESAAGATEVFLVKTPFCM